MAAVVWGMVLRSMVQLDQALLNTQALQDARNWGMTTIRVKTDHRAESYI